MNLNARTKEELMFMAEIRAEREMLLWKKWNRYNDTGQSEKRIEMRNELQDLVNEIIEICDVLDSKYNTKVIKNIHGKLEFINKEEK